MKKTYRAEMWINDGSAVFIREGTNKIKLLKEGMALVRQCHAHYPGYSSSVTIYDGDEMIKDCILINDKTYFKHFNGHNRNEAE